MKCLWSTGLLVLRRSWMRTHWRHLSSLFVLLILLGCPRLPEYSDCVVTGECECRGPGDCPDGQNCINGFCGHYPDAAVFLLGFGEPCQLDVECESGFCVTAGSGTGKVCTMTCQGDCPSGWDCKRRHGDETVDLCLQHLDRLCLGCTVDEHCHPAFGDRCVTLDDGMQVCAQDCTHESCSQGYTCTSINTAQGPHKQCLPEQGSCACNSENVGLERGCTTDNIYGSCYGTTVCQQSGEWTDCTGAEAAAEICNGQDDDCDGWIDAEDSSVDISQLAATPAYPRCQTGNAPTCQGMWTCQADQIGTFAWVCDATNPVAEICDGLDNNCNGLDDEDFVDAEGRYVHPNHCALCGFDCTSLLSNLATDQNGEVVFGAVTCQVRGDQPVCVPQLCAEGYAPYPELAPVTCLPIVSPQCRHCTEATDCLFAADRCAAVGYDPHASCLQGCAPNAPYGGCSGLIGQRGCCPSGSLCDLVEGALVCVPEANSCDCDSDNLGVSRSCFVDGSEGAVCLGQQTCSQLASGPAWNDCDASTTSLEVCDGVDNDCSGVIDDPFVDQRGSGTYDTDEHCGQCHHNCLAQWSPEIQHAIGGCVVSDSGEPDCEIVACTSESVYGGTVCRLDTECPTGYSCDPDFHICRKSCAGPADCSSSGGCQEGWCVISCQSDGDCAQGQQVISRCEDGTCQTLFEYRNVDQVSSNGCECPAPSAVVVDEPEVYDSYPEAGQAYVDRDCDGVDGSAQNALFVWAGSDTNLGTRDAPFATINQALDVYDPAQHSQILVAAGYYRETLHLFSGVRLFGGYEPGFASRDIVIYSTIIAGPEPDHNQPNLSPGVVNAVDIQAGETVLAGFVIFGYDVNYRPLASETGKSSYALYLRNSSSAVVVANNMLVAGRGGDGGHGNAGSPGAAGNSGGDGLNSRECTSDFCTNESQNGGSGGLNGACAQSQGRPGAPSSGDVDPQAYATGAEGNGTGGTNASYTSESNPDWIDLCKYDCQVPDNMNGQDAQSGNNGMAGEGALGCSAAMGAVVNGLWQGGSGIDGNGGTLGSGGGGGGAGGCVVNLNPHSCTVGNRVGDLGGTGGGGGAGGCGGTGGSGGGAGGGSFAVFIAYTASVTTLPVISANIILRGEGGAAGNGGYGGHGGLGGEGGEGGVPENPAWCAGFGGKGGRGGDGGSGGGGGGGCGGVSFGIAGNQLGSSSYATVNEFPQGGAPMSGGPAGAGGPSPAGAGANGLTGVSGAWGDVHVF